MNISAINNNYSLTCKSQTDTYSQTTGTTNTYPAYLDEEKDSKSSNLGLIALGILAAAGVGYGLYTKKDVSSKLKELTENKTALNETKTALEKAKTKITELESAKGKAEKTISDLTKGSKNFATVALSLSESR